MNLFRSKYGLQGAVGSVILINMDYIKLGNTNIDQAVVSFRYYLGYSLRKFPDRERSFSQILHNNTLKLRDS